MTQGADLTKEIFQYGEIRQFLWNTYFAHKIDNIMHPRVDIFFDLEGALFRALILEAHEEGLGNWTKTEGLRKHLRVRLNSPIEALTNCDTKPRRSFGYKSLDSSDWQERYLLFVDLFDWYRKDPLGRCSFPYVEIEPRLEIDERTEERWLVRKTDVKSVYFVD